MHSPRDARLGQWRWLPVAAAAGVAAYALAIGVRFALYGKTADFVAFMQGARAAAAGASLYAGDSGYIYPPLLAVLLRPLLWLPTAAAAVVWVAAQWMLMVGVALFSARLAQRQAGLDPRPARTVLIAAAAYLVLGDKLILELRDGNCDAIIVACWLGALCSLGRRPALVGLCLGLAINIKYTAAVLLPYLLLSRRWREAAWTCACTALLALLPAAQMGWTATINAWAGALRGLSGLVAGGPIPPPGAQIHPATWGLSVSLTSALARLSAAAELPAPWGQIGSVLLVLSIAAGVWRLYHRAAAPMPWSSARNGGRAPDLLTAIEWWGLLAAMLIFSPQTPTRHLNMALPAVALAAVLGASAPAGLARRFQWAALAGLGAALWLPPSSDWTRGAVHAWRFIGGPSAALLVLTIATTLLALRRHATAARPSLLPPAFDAGARLDPARLPALGQSVPLLCRAHRPAPHPLAPPQRGQNPATSPAPSPC